MRALKSATALAVLLALDASGSALGAQAVDAAIRNCQDAALLRLRATYPTRSSIVFAPNARARMYFNHAADVQGTGLVQEPSLLAWRRFVYRCAYKVQTRQTILNVSVEPQRLFPAS